MFILTDGGISNKKETCHYVGKFSNNTRVHSFGFGSGADRYLVKELAKQGKGNYHFIENSASNLEVNSAIISALWSATVPALTNLTHSWSFDEMKKKNHETFYAFENLIVSDIIDK